MRILNLQNTILVSLLVAGAAASAACSSSDAARPDAGAGTSSTTGGTGNSAGTGATTGGTSSGGSTPIAGSGNGGTGSPTGGTGGAPGPSVCDGTASRVLMNTPADAFIDDFEKMQADATTASPAWYGFNDIMPPNSVQILRTPGGAASTAFGGHYAGMGAKTPLMMGYGVGVEINVGVDKTIPQYCVDASAFTGVSFWAKAATATNAKISAGFVVPSQNQVMFGGDCPDATPAKCNNYPQKDFVLTTDWANYTVDFATVTGATGAKVVGGKIQQILWLAPTTDWDFSLDEVAFYSGTPPAGAVAPPAGTGGTGGTGSGGSGGSN
jgi:hypothetical protein